MNKLNGGYIMIDGSSSTLQADLKKAYETGRPVLYYENGKAEYARIEKMNNLYYVYPLNDYVKQYLIEIIVDGEGDFGNNTNIQLKLLTKDDLLYVNSDDADVAQNLYGDIEEYSTSCILEAQTISTYDVVGGHITDEETIVLLYNDNNVIKKTTLYLGNIKSIHTMLN